MAQGDTNLNIKEDTSNSTQDSDLNLKDTNIKTQQVVDSTTVSPQEDHYDDDATPYTVQNLLDILTAPSGGLFMMPSNAFDEVYPNLYIGEESIAKSRSGLQRLGITHIVNTAEGKDDGYHVHTNHVMYRQVNIQYLGIEATDMMSFNLSKYFDKCADYIEKALDSGGKVMVNCKQGGSRSATIVLAFLMIKRRMRVQDAVRSVREHREICPNDGFLKQLCDLNEKLKKANHFS